MSGGSYNYLYAKLGGDTLDQGPEMITRLEELGYPLAADHLREFVLSRPAPQSLVDLVKAVEWYDSADWGFKDVDEAYQRYYHHPDQ